MMNVYKSKVPGCVYGGDCIGSLVDILKKEGAKSVVVFTDKGIRGAGLLDPVTAAIESAGVKFAVVDDIVPEPAYTVVEKVIAEVNDASAGLIIAVGGGSVMDSAKLCSLLKGGKTTVKDLLKDPLAAKKQIKTVMIPTTCGTGAEATCNAIVAVPEDSIKVGIVNDDMIPDYVLLAPSMIAKLPKSIIAGTGVDALAHGVECFTSKKANPLSDTYALACCKLIFANIRNAYSDEGDMEAKANMLMGAYYGGMAITASGTTAVHALSYPLGGKFHIPHGVSNAILFKHVMKFNLDACAERLAMICDAINPSLSGENVIDRAEYVVSQIADIVAFTNIPSKLQEYGVKKSDMGFLVDAAFGVKRLLNNNVKVLSKDDIRGIYEKVM